MKRLLTSSMFWGVGAALLLFPFIVFGQEPVNQFVPLTGLPGLDGIRSTEGLANFLNALYKLCIGVAASLAIIQLIRAGWLIMINTGSFMHNERARSIIRDSVFGLILVLSPAVVFGIIDPRILDLNLDFSKLEIGEVGPGAYQGGGNPDDASMPPTEDIRAAAEACGVTLSETQIACMEEESLSDRQLQDCLMAGGANYDQVRCIIGQSYSDDPGTLDVFPEGTEGTYVGYGRFSWNYGPPTVGANTRAQGWLSATCPAPKQSIIGSCVSTASHSCALANAVCKVSMTANIIRISEAGAWVDVGVSWEPLRSQDNTAIVTFRNECRAAVRALNWEQVNTPTGGGVDGRIKTELTQVRNCSQQEVIASGRVYHSTEEYRCAQETYTCDVRP